ncbi:MAG: tRNA (N6-threonylcarbamoyladenosine(37)-N6)-methyltransferase TrmO [Candidatus Aminicenantes bacterium]|nr:tRNA (N6-threonylcarbamoyladenosine(37)-N6)-methyltransferase TrmO [Candidatus Aminicenantes bacterium]
MNIKLKPIGVVHSPFRKPRDIPKSRVNDAQTFESIEGKLEIFKEFQEGLKDIDGFSHLIVLFSFHESSEEHLTAHPPFESKPHGVFATRSPHRPNLIGMTVVKLIERQGNILKVSGIDMIEGTPLLDIKPYTKRDQKMDIRLGWIEAAQRDSMKDQNEL